MVDNINVTGEQKLLALLAHLSYFLGGLGFIIAPLVIFLLKRDDPFVADHARQALVAHLAVLAASIFVALLCLLLVGVFLIPILIILFLILLATSLIASANALDGKLYRYPLIQDLVSKLE